jgi:hypothetical protein
MCNEIEVREIVHGDPPFLKVLGEIIYGLLGRELMLFIVFRPAAPTHPNDVNQNEMKLFHDGPKYLIEQRSRASISMNKHTGWLRVILATDGCSYGHRLLLVLTHLNVLH